MTHRRTIQRRAGPLFGAFLVLVAAALAFTPVVPTVGAIDPTLAPSEAATPAPDPTPTPVLDPTPTPSESPTLAPDPSSAPDPSVSPSPDPTPTPTPDPSPSPTPDPSPSPDPTPTPTPDPSPSPDPKAEPSPSLSPEPVRGTLVLTSDAPPGGRHRIDPGAVLNLALLARVETPASSVRLVAQLPAGWTVDDPDGGVVDATARTIQWSLGDVPDRIQAAVAPRLRAPVRSPAGEPAFRATIEARLEHAGGIAVTDSVTVLVAPALVVEHSVFARVETVTQDPTYLATDADLTGVLRFDAFRVRFQVRNADLPAAAMAPSLQYRLGGSATFVDVPVGDSLAGVPFYVAAEWRRTGVGTGTLPGPAQEPINAREIAIRDTDDPTQAPATGRRIMGPAGMATITVPGDSYTEVEFTVRASIDLPPGGWFELRLTDGGRAITSGTSASVISESTPRVELTPGQRDGVPVGPPVDARTSNSRGIGGVDFPLVTPAAIAATWSDRGGTPIYRLAVALFASPHAPDTSLVSDTCAACHSAHAAQGTPLLAKAAPQAQVCLACHDGTGSSLNVSTQYADTAVPANDATTRSFYRHDAITAPLAPNTHSSAQVNEFGGISNRHSLCTDCHNSHNATATAPTQTITGWTVSGRQAAISGVSVANGGARAAPTYTFLDGTAGRQPTREYEICLKCHSGFTTLNSNDPLHPSRDTLDAGIEFNPNNASYHPVEAPGTNGTTAMIDSLAGTSPYKQWNFAPGDTVRCVNCHGDPQKWNATLPPNGTGATVAGADLAPHTSNNRGILIQNYRDRVLKSSDEAYAAADSALCLVCHAEEGFVSNSSSATNFRLHQEHVTIIGGKGNGGTDIDTPGAGQGNSVCAECHFRIHGTALAYQVGDRTNTRLVNFAPNVLPNSVTGVLSWTATGIGTGSCTLTCHGYDHKAKGY
jgi:predicted CXXCH cytochrome family protein